MKQKSPSLPRNLALGTFSELSIVLSTMVNLLSVIDWAGSMVLCLLICIMYDS